MRNGESRELNDRWNSDPRWDAVERPYSADDVLRLRGSLRIEYTLARHGAERLWHLLRTEPFIRSLGAQSGQQAVQIVQAGLKAIYVSGWQVAGDMNTAGQTYPDQSLYPANSVPAMVKRVNQALQRADQIDHAEGRHDRYWYAPIVADAEAGFGGPLNAHELMKSMTEAGAAGVHFEDQLAAVKKCGHMGGKVLVPTQEAVQKLIAALSDLTIRSQNPVHRPFRAQVLGRSAALKTSSIPCHSSQLRVRSTRPRDLSCLDREYGIASQATQQVWTPGRIRESDLSLVGN